MWQYALWDYDPLVDGTEEEWAAKVADGEWRTWLPASGEWIVLGGRRVRRWSLRRPCARPFSVHVHDHACGQRALRDALG